MEIVCTMHALLRLLGMKTLLCICVVLQVWNYTQMLPFILTKHKTKLQRLFKTPLIASKPAISNFWQIGNVEWEMSSNWRSTTDDCSRSTAICWQPFFSKHTYGLQDFWNHSSDNLHMRAFYFYPSAIEDLPEEHFSCMFLAWLTLF